VTRVLPVTSYPGNEREPSLSPDGHQVAFSWDGGNGHWHIYIKLLGESNSRRLTSTEADDTFPVWSPDGKYIAFIRSRTQVEGDIMLIPSIGGPERSLHPINIGFAIEGAKRLMSWTPDGKWLCFTSRESAESHHRLFLLSTESGSTRPMLSKAVTNDADDDAAPAFSPDGRWLVFARFYGAFNSKLWFQRITDDLHTEGELLAVSETLANATVPVWVPDSKSVLFLDSYGHRVMQAEMGHPARLVYATEATLEGLTFSASEQALVTSSHTDDDDLWFLPLKGLRPGGSATPFAPSTAVERAPRFSPDGRSIAFISNRSGEEQIWVADAIGDNLRQVTHLNAVLVGRPWWSPDGTLLAFHARMTDQAQIYTVRLRDGFTKQLTYGPRGFTMPSFSEDGKTVYMLEPAHGTTLLYRLSLAAASPQFLWPGLYAVESPKQNMLLYAKSDQLGIYARSLRGDLLRNPEVQIVPDYFPPNGKFQPVDDGIYYVSYSASRLPRAFSFYSFATKQSLDIAQVPAGYSGDLTVTPDRSRLAYTTETKGNYDLVQLVLK
jgi:Tol biopolymer transport system component